VPAIVFDFDGVIANSEPLHLAAMQEVLSALGVSLTQEEYYSQLLGYDDDANFRKIAQDRGWPIDEERIGALIEEKARVFDAAIEGANVLFPGAAECVARLGAAFPLGIASGALKHEIKAVLLRYGLEHHFSFIVAAGDTPRGKPAPDPYRRATELHGLPPNTCVAIEDSMWGIESANAAGLATIAVAHTYRARELRSADRVVESLDEITVGLIEEIVGSSA